MNSPVNPEPQTPEEFLTMLRSEFELPIEIELGSSLCDDARFDSLEILELISYLEWLVDPSGRQLLLEFPILASIADAYSIYVQLHSWVNRPDTPS